MLRAASAAIVPALILVSLIAFVATANAGDLGELRAGGGFDGARLGASFDSFSGLERIGGDSQTGTETYVRPSDDLRVGGVRVDGISYSFYQGRLYFISLSMSGRTNSQAVLAAFEAALGPSIETGSHPNERIWPAGSQFVLYDYDPDTDRGMAAMTSTPIHAQIHPTR